MNNAINLGPWEACGNLIRTKREADGSGGFLVAEVPANTGHTTEKALVMAAAPELIEALRSCVAALPAYSDEAKQARAALAKATGVQA